jgi:hypothetical protein
MKGNLLIFCLTFFSWVYAQDTLQTKDSIVHPFKRAMMFSAIVPGGGQIYNSIHLENGRKKAYWKVPLIYSAIGTGGFFLINNQLNQKSLKTEYSNRLSGSANLNPKWEAYDTQGVLQLYRQYLDWRDLSILALFAIYGFQILDAGVEAHFLKFDVSDDLSIKLNPQFNQFGNVGVRATIRW